MSKVQSIYLKRVPHEYETRELKIQNVGELKKYIDSYPDNMPLGPNELVIQLANVGAQEDPDFLGGGEYLRLAEYIEPPTLDDEDPEMLDGDPKYGASDEPL